MSYGKQSSHEGEAHCIPPPRKPPFNISSSHIPIFQSLLQHLASALQDSYTLSGVQKEKQTKAVVFKSESGVGGRSGLGAVAKGSINTLKLCVMFVFLQI